MIRCLIGLLLPALALVATGCQSAWITVQNLPIEVAKSTTTAPVPVYDLIAQPPSAGVPFANMAILGNGFTNDAYLRKQAGERGGKIGADFVIVTGGGSQYAGSVTTYGGGIAITTPVQAPVLYATAFVKTRAKIGVRWDDRNEVLDVLPDSPADRAGIRVGERLLAINATRLQSNQLAVWQEIARLSPGDEICLEVAAVGQPSRTVNVVAASND